MLRTFATEHEPAAAPGEDALLRVSGEVTYAEAPELREVLFAAIEEGREARRLRVDLSGVERIDTAGFAVLMEGLMATRKRRPRMELCSPSPPVQRMFQLAGFLSLKSESPDTRFYDALRRCCGDEARGRDPRIMRRSRPSTRGADSEGRGARSERL